MTLPTDPGRNPVTDRGRRTRAGLIAAARVVFERRGFAATRMGDITAEAGVSHGTVYTYFDTKEDVLAAAVQELVADIRESIRTSENADPVQRIWLANTRYLTAYASHAKLMRVVEEVSTSDSRFAEILADLRRTHASRVSGHIGKMQEAGIVASEVEPDSAAAALCAMVEGYARNWTDGVAADLAGSARSLTYLWANALGLPLASGISEAALDESISSQDVVSQDVVGQEAVGQEEDVEQVAGQSSEQFAEQEQVVKQSEDSVAAGVASEIIGGT